MASENTSSWPKTAAGNPDWEAVFENPESGLIALISQARSPAALRKSTTLVIESIYARDGAPPNILGFIKELEHMLPDALPVTALPKVTGAITTVLREIKEERINQDSHRNQDQGKATTNKPKASKKSRGWAATRNKKSAFGSAKVFASIAILLITLGAGGGGYYFFIMDHAPAFDELTRTLIEEMKQAAEGYGPEQHVFGWPLTVESRGGLTGVTAIGVPAAACASAAWYFVNRGNVLINDNLPKKVAPNLLKRFCEEKGHLAKLTWLSKTPIDKTKVDAGETNADN